MSYNTFPEFNLDDLTGLDDNYLYGKEFGFEGLDWDQSGIAGPSQPYAGVDVSGDLNNYPDFPSPSTAPTSLFPTHEVPLDEGKSGYTF